jgi:biotin-dependent carboxylase-like uncharacterized protein
MSFLVTAADGLVTVQDRGRVGYAHLGVPRAGALDLPAAALANRLVGNDENAAVLEVTLAGLALRTDRALTFAVTGALCDVRLGRRAVAFAEPVSAPAGTDVWLGPAHRGARSYLAVAGGIDAPEVLGSRSTDTLAGVGPARVTAGDRVLVGRRGAGAAAADVPRPQPAPGRLRLLPGPRPDWFPGSALASLADTSYVVAADSNRVGLRLTGPPVGRRAGELPSEGMVLGAVQVPPNGQPVVLLADHPVTGGYPVVGVVAQADLWVCAQLRPGDRIGFRIQEPPVG